ncbi:MAG TPA: hypothetical protein VF311_10585 [Terriglobales bacterium]
METYKLDVLLFKEGDAWVAQCLQYDVAAQGENARECMAQLGYVLIGRVIVAAELGMRHPFENLPQAPSRFWRRFEKGLEVVPRESLFQIPEGTPPAFMIDPSSVELRID